MRKLLTLAVAGLLAIGFTGAGRAAQEDVVKHPSCKYCGMDRAKFSHSRMYVEYDDGSAVGTCSIHCAAVDLVTSLDKAPKAIWVGDFNSGNLIDAEKASWVMGGSKMGVMTRRAKWAFASPAAAGAFMKENGGTSATFDEVVKASFEDMYDDLKMIRQRRAEMRRKMMEHK